MQYLTKVIKRILSLLESLMFFFQSELLIHLQNFLLSYC